MMYRRLALVMLAPLLLTGAVAGHAATPAQAAPAQETPGWQQVNTNGFGVPQAAEVSALEPFGAYLYAGTTNTLDGARLYRSPDGTTWTPVSEPGFGIAHDIRPLGILDLAVYNGRLYATTGRTDNAAQIWRAQDGLTWAPVVITGFDDPDTVDITALIAYNGALYAGTHNLVKGAQVWRSYSGDNNTWTQAAPAQSGSGPGRVTGFAVFDGALYAAIESEAPAQIWRTYGGEWTTVVDDGFGSALTTVTGSLTEFAGYLYVGAGNETSGAQLWRTADAAIWEPAIAPAFGDAHNEKVEAVFVFQNQLYASAKNTTSGLELWRSPGGLAWEQVNPDGFGDNRNSGVNGSNATASFLGHLYVGTANAAAGGEVWRMLQPQQHTYLPLIVR